MRFVRSFICALAMASAAALSVAAPACAQEAGISLQLDPATESMRAALEDAIAPLQGEGASDLQAERDAKDAIRRLTDYLNSQAYFDPALSIESATEDGVSISVSAGRLFTIGALSVGIEDDRAQAAALTETLVLKPGDPVVPSVVLAEESRLVRRLQEQGFAFARALERDAVGDRAAGTIDLTLKIDPGASIVLGRVIYPEGLQQPARFLQRLVPFDEGAAYAPSTLSDLNDALAETGLYRIASARLAPEGRMLGDGRAEYDVIVTAQERAPHTLSIGASFATSEGAGVTGEWIYRNAAGRGDTLITSAVIAPQERTLNAVWRLPNAAGRHRSLVFGGAGGREETDGFDRDFFTLDGGLEIRRDERNRLRYGASLERSRETPIGTARTLTDLYDLMIASVSASVVRDRTDSLLDPSKGWRADLRAEPGVVFGDVSANYVHGVAQASTYRSFGGSDQFVAALRAKVGVTAGAGAIDLPTSRRFYAGGGGSVRGFDFQDIGPKDASGRPIGGRSLTELSGEVRWRRDGRWDGAVFIDAGRVSTREVPGLSGLETGAGFGVIYNTPAGPLRADIAWPLSRSEGLGDVKVYLSLGQAF